MLAVGMLGLNLGEVGLGKEPPSLCLSALTRCHGSLRAGMGDGLYPWSAVG